MMGISRCEAILSSFFWTLDPTGGDLVHGHRRARTPGPLDAVPVRQGRAPHRSPNSGRAWGADARRPGAPRVRAGRRQPVAGRAVGRADRADPDRARRAGRWRARPVARGRDAYV